MIPVRRVVEDFRPSVLPPWVSLWLIISTIICTMDIAYTLNRPYTNDLSKPIGKYLYGGWNLYSSVDMHYKTTDDIISNSLGRLMIVECLLNLISVGLAFARSRHAILIAFTTTVMVFWKTVYYFSLFICDRNRQYSSMNQNIDIFDNFMIFWVPNGVWVIMPLFVIIKLWNKLAIPPLVVERYWDNHAKCRGEIIFKKDD